MKIFFKYTLLLNSILIAFSASSMNHDKECDWRNRLENPKKYKMIDRAQQRLTINQMHTLDVDIDILAAQVKKYQENLAELMHPHQGESNNSHSGCAIDDIHEDIDIDGIFDNPISRLIKAQEIFLQQHSLLERKQQELAERKRTFEKQMKSFDNQK